MNSLFAIIFRIGQKNIIRNQVSLIKWVLEILNNLKHKSPQLEFQRIYKETFENVKNE